MGTVKINIGYTPEEMKNSEWFGSGGGGFPKGRTPEEIKKGLECCIGESGYHFCHECPYSSSGSYCMESNEADALAYIQQLEYRLAQVKRERDAAVHDLEESSFCADCKHYEESGFNEPCSSCMENAKTKKNWQWRGVCPENMKEET